MRKVAAGGWNDPLDPYDGLGAGDAGFIPGCGDPLYDPVKRFCVLGVPPVVEKYGREPVENSGKDRDQ